MTWHTLRHTSASRLVDRGVDIVTVQQLLGHSTVTVTMRYTHTNLDSKRAAVAKLESRSGNLHQNAAGQGETVTKRKAKSCILIQLETEECVSGRNGRS